VSKRLARQRRGDPAGEDRQGRQVQLQVQLADDIQEGQPVPGHRRPHVDRRLAGIGLARRVAGQQHPGLLIGLADGGDAQGRAVLADAVPARGVVGPGRIVVAGVALAAGKDQGAGREVDLVMALDHQHLESRLVAQQQDRGGGADGVCHRTRLARKPRGAQGFRTDVYPYPAAAVLACSCRRSARSSR
jgi:hypothetical protein